MASREQIIRAQMYIDELEHTLIALQLTHASAGYNHRVYGDALSDTTELIKRCARILFVKAKFTPTRDLLSTVLKSHAPLNVVLDQQAEYYKVIGKTT